MCNNRLLARMSFHSTALYRGHTYNPEGSIELARTPERRDDLVREPGPRLVCLRVDDGDSPRERAGAVGGRDGG